jgi:hypothetical protein
MVPSARQVAAAEVAEAPRTREFPYWLVSDRDNAEDVLSSRLVRSGQARLYHILYKGLSADSRSMT